MTFFLTFLGAFAIIIILLATLSDLGERTNRFQVSIFFIGLAFTLGTVLGPYSGGPFNPLWPLVFLLGSVTLRTNDISSYSQDQQWVYVFASTVGLLAAFGLHTLFAFWLPERAGGHPAAHKNAPVVPRYSNISAPVRKRHISTLVVKITTI